MFLLGKYDCNELYANMDVLNYYSLGFWNLVHREDWQCEFFISDEEKYLVRKNMDFLKTLLLSIPEQNDFQKINYAKIENYQKVIDELKNLFWVRVGLSEQNDLRVDMDLKDRTSLRELIVIVFLVRGLLTAEGLLTHIGSAFPDSLKVFCILTGFHVSKTIFYTKNFELITPIRHLACAPCSLTALSPYNKECSDAITPEQVIEAIKKEFG